MSFETAIEHVLGLEKGYSNHPSDRGGKTRWGITEAVARAFGYTGPMTDLPLETAKLIYRKNYWDILHLDDVAKVSSKIALELFDTAVNCSPGFAGTALQRSLNAFNRQGRAYPDLKVDGLVGLMTVASLKSFLTLRFPDGEKVLLRVLNSLQGAHYISITEARSANEDFTYGWFLNRVVI